MGLFLNAPKSYHFLVLSDELHAVILHKGVGRKLNDPHTNIY